ncbi:iron-containing alcohol dehydrogenase [Bacteroides sp. 224]|uniref:iron-containing alcohol dehydrogenase n=1 Tax=Bacteroides sp. 224 TaxID=2302936 RepID=UPI0013D2AED7|nr:iron-containing alcohol dehydrogenase [Bacteroides sp. 224]NDV64254.1 iron-containing alcohol dehydrogenase [Bacteroides sp. 224]
MNKSTRASHSLSFGEGWGEALTILQPNKIVFGTGCSTTQFCEDFRQLGYKRLFILTAPPILPLIKPMLEQLEADKVSICIYEGITQEPTVAHFYEVLEKARDFNADSVIGVGGGSVLDTAKLVAALIESDQKVEDIFGTGFLKSRKRWLACLPTTAGTGSEVSPNSILLDEKDKLKKGIVSPYLVADAAYLDPQLTVTVPPKITAETGMDALTHCIEAYTNKFAHPVIDMYARMGMELIASNLLRAVKDGKDIEAREALLLGSYYGGICLGPVNTAAVHALSYPLGGEFHISHGLANAILLPSVMKFNRSADVRKYAEVAIACGAPIGKNNEETAENGVNHITQLSKDCGIPTKLSEIGIPQEAVDGMAKAAMQVTRLLKNNPREVTLADAKAIYESLF